jgi:hypothetical protein
MARVTITLQPDEKAALSRLAESKRRDPRDQAALLVRQGLEQSGVLSSADAPAQDRRPETKEENHT